MAAPRRLPFPAVVLATVVAVAAAVGVYALLGAVVGDDGPSDGAAAATMELSPTGELPASVAEVRLGALDGGDDAALGDLIGERPVVVNFFAHWCVPCRDEMPAFEAAHQQLGDRVQFVGLAVRDRPTDALAIVEETGVSYPAYADPDSSALTYFGGTSMPTTVFIDAQGEVVDVASEVFTEESLRARIADRLGVP